jgi:hypothetical protein
MAEVLAELVLRTCETKVGAAWEMRIAVAIQAGRIGNIGIANWAGESFFQSGQNLSTCDCWATYSPRRSMASAGARAPSGVAPITAMQLNTTSAVTLKVVRMFL